MTTEVALDVRTPLFEPNENVDAVYFPRDGVVSLVTPAHSGSLVEVATIGSEGVVGVPLDQPLTGFAVRATTQIAGHGLRVETTVFADLVERSPTLTTLIDRYTQALLGQIAQAAACNRIHSSEERLSRSLLMTQDRVDADEFLITHELLAQMVGATRSTVSVTTGILKRAGLIRCARGHVTIVDRDGLAAVSCECYALMHAELARVQTYRRGLDPDTVLTTVRHVVRRIDQLNPDR